MYSCLLLLSLVIVLCGTLVCFVVSEEKADRYARAVRQGCHTDISKIKNWPKRSAFQGLLSASEDDLAAVRLHFRCCFSSSPSPPPCHAPSSPSCLSAVSAQVLHAFWSSGVAGSVVVALQSACLYLCHAYVRATHKNKPSYTVNA